MSRVRWVRMLLALALLGATASCAYYNTFYLARKYYLKATDGQPYDVDRDGTTQRQNYTKSGDYSKKLLGIYPKSKFVDDAWLLWARALLGTDDPLKAVAMLQEFETRFPKSELRPDASFFLGLAYRAARKQELAVQTFDEFLAQAPKHTLVPYAYYERSKALMSLQRYPEAANSAGEILARYPRHLLVDRALRQRAEARYQQHAWQGARDDFHTLGNRALTDDERLAFLLREVDCLESSRSYDEARALLNDARSHVPPPPPPPVTARVGTGGISSQAQQPTMLQLAPGQDKYGRLTLRMGGVELLAGRVDKAIELYRAVLQDYPRTALAAEAQFRIGYAYETGADDFTRARTEFTKVKEQTGTSQFSQQAQQRLDNLERIERFRSAAGVDSAARKAEARFLTAEHYLFNLDRPDRAIEEYRAIADSTRGTAVAARALNAEAWVLSRKLGNKTGADSLFWIVVRNYPATQSQLDARDYLEAEGQVVPVDLIVPPVQPAKPVLEEADSTAGPEGTGPPGAQKPPSIPEPAAVRYGPGVNPAGATPGLPSVVRYSGVPDSLRRMMVLRDSLLRMARTDTSSVGRARLDSLRRALARPDTSGRGAMLASIERMVTKADGVTIAPGDSIAPDLKAVDTLTTAPALGRGTVPAAPRVEAPLAPPWRATAADSARAKRDTSHVSAPASRVTATTPLAVRRDSAEISVRDSVRRLPVVATRRDSVGQVVRDTVRTRPAPPVPPVGAAAVRETPKPPAPARREITSFRIPQPRLTRAQRDSVKRAKAHADSLRRRGRAPAVPRVEAPLPAPPRALPRDSTRAGRDTSRAAAAASPAVTGAPAMAGRDGLGGAPAVQVGGDSLGARLAMPLRRDSAEITLRDSVRRRPAVATRRDSTGKLVRDTVRTKLVTLAGPDTARAKPVLTRLTPAQRDSVKRVRAVQDSLRRMRAIRDSLRAQAESAVALRDRFKRYDPLRVEAARRDSLRRAKVTADSLKRARAHADSLKHARAHADSLKRARARADSLAGRRVTAPRPVSPPVPDTARSPGP